MCDLAPVEDLNRERRIRAIVADLRALLDADPALNRRTEAMLAGALPALEEPLKHDRSMTVRLPEDALTRADALVPALESHPLLGAASVSRSVVIRLALDRGLAALEAEFSPAAAPSPEPRRAPPKARTPKPATVAESAPARTTRDGTPRKRQPKAPPPATGPAADLRRWRQEQGIKRQAEAAARVDVAQATWSRWERGDGAPGPDDAAKLEELTGIPASAWGEV